MPQHPERQLARIRAHFEQHAQELTCVGFLLKGSLLERFKRCSSAGCACQVDPAKRHGPYWQWTGKVRGKTVTRILRSDEVPRYREWMANAQRFETIVQNLYELSAQADQVLRAQERQAAGNEARASRGRPRSPS